MWYGPARILYVKLPTDLVLERITAWFKQGELSAGLQGIGRVQCSVRNREFTLTDLAVGGFFSTWRYWAPYLLGTVTPEGERTRIQLKLKFREKMWVFMVILVLLVTAGALMVGSQTGRWQEGLGSWVSGMVTITFISALMSFLSARMFSRQPWIAAIEALFKTERLS